MYCETELQQRCLCKQPAYELRHISVKVDVTNSAKWVPSVYIVRALCHIVCPMKYSHGFGVFILLVVRNPCDTFANILQGCFPGTRAAIVWLPRCRVTHVPWCMSGSLTSGFLWSWWRGKLSRHSRRIHNLQFYVSGKRFIENVKPTSMENDNTCVLCKKYIFNFEST